MKSRRRTSIIILVAASVFLCLLASCGIPTYLVPTVTFTKSSTDPASFTVKYKGDGVGDTGKVGLLLLYYIGDVTSSEDSKITSKFSSTYKVSTYDGIVVSPEDDTPLYTITTSGGETGNVYAFELDNVPVVAPVYTLSMSTAGDFSNVIRFEFIDEDIYMFVDGVKQDTPISIDHNIVLSSSDCIRVYAAISVQSSQYSNLYWSSLPNVGYIRVE